MCTDILQKEAVSKEAAFFLNRFVDYGLVN